MWQRGAPARGGRAFPKTPGQMARPEQNTKRTPGRRGAPLQAAASEKEPRAGEADPRPRKLPNRGSSNPAFFSSP